MNFLNKIKSSIYNREFYREIMGQKISTSLRYFFSLVCVLSLIIAFFTGIEMSPVFSKENLRQLADFYPKELGIQIKGGVVSTNVAEPYFIRNNFDYPNKSGDKLENFVVIDTKNNFSVESFNSYSTSVLIGKNFYVASKRQGQFEFTNIGKMPDFSLSQARIIHWADLIGSHHLGLSLALFFFFFLSFFGFFSMELLALLVLALLIMLLARIKKTSLSYKNCYNIGIYAVTFPLIIKTIFILGKIPVPSSILFAVMILAIAFVNVEKQNQITS